jgi:hypothetical protein
MQADGTAALQKSNHGNLPFHLSSLDFDTSPIKLQLLSSEQLGVSINSSGSSSSISKQAG